MPELAHRILAHIRVDPDTGCWIWTRPTNAYGYGQIGVVVGGKHTSVRVHRALYEELVGPIPAGQQLDHTCHNEDAQCSGGVTCPHRACANPEHLQPATNQENTSRGRAPDVNRERQLAKPRCDQGHPLDGLNVHVTAQGFRTCRACKREWARAAGKTGARGPRRRVVRIVGRTMFMECGHSKDMSPSRHHAYALCGDCEALLHAVEGSP